MNTLRYTRTSYVAAFLLGALLALMVLLPARGAEPASFFQTVVVGATADIGKMLR